MNMEPMEWAQLICSTDIFLDPIKISKNKFEIGRSKDCDLALKDNPYVSSKHCQIVKEGESIYLEDTSTNGSVINGRLKISNKRVSLNHGDEINIVLQANDSEKNVAYVFQELSKINESDSSTSTVELNNTIAYDNEIVINENYHDYKDVLPKRKHSDTDNEHIDKKKNACLDPENCIPSTSKNILNNSAETIILNSNNIKNDNCHGDVSKELRNNDDDHDDDDKDLLESLTCTICQEIYYKCISLQPCMHSFCSGCYSEWMDTSNDCPTCRGNVERINRNHLLNNLVDNYLKKYPDKKRDNDDIKILDLKNKITADMLNIKKKKPSYDDEDNSEYGDYSNSDSDDDNQIFNLMNNGPIYPIQHPWTNCRPVCRQCPAPNNQQLNRQASYECKPMQNHFLCQCCMQPMPDRTIHPHNLNSPQYCDICRIPYCHLYWTCKKTDCRGCLSEFQEMNVNDRDIKDIILNNGFESDLLKSYLVANKMDASLLLAECYKKLMDGSFHCTNEINIKNADAFCRKCFFKNFSELAYQYRENIRREDVEKLVGVRPDCYWGKFCRTQISKPLHAAKFNHICDQSRYQ